MAVVVDMTGRALTTVANPCGYFTAVYNSTYTPDRCSAGWRRLGEEIDLEPHFLPSHLGFLCARSFIRVESTLVGMVIVGGVAPATWLKYTGSTAPMMVVANAEFAQSYMAHPQIAF